MQEPYKGLRPYEEQDQENFFGREAEKQILVDKILAHKLTLLFAASGVGKSSLLQAAVIPQLRCVEGKTLDVVYHKNWFAHPIVDLKHTLNNALQQGRKSQTYERVDEQLSLADFLSDCTLFTSVPFILVLDQFEEFFTSRYNLAHREEFVEQLAEAIQDRETETIFVIAMREDFAMEMEVFRKFLPSIFDHLYRLKKLSLENARNAIVAPLTRLGFRYEPTLLEELLKDLGSREQEERSAESVGLPQKLILSVEPPHLQIICTQLWEAEQGNPQQTITQAVYHHRGRAKGLLKNYFLKRMIQFSAPEKRMVSRTFDVLVSQYGTKSARPLNELARVVEVIEAILAPVLDKLDQARILRLQTRHGELWYELYHDVFAEHVVTWNEKYKNQQRWRKVLWRTGSGLAFSVLLVVGYDTWVNAVNHHFRLSVKAGISDTIEVWQGKKGSWDRWGQQTFHYETDYGRGDLEADKLFVQHSVEELANLHHELIGSFPLAERLLAYRDDGGAYRDQTGKPGVALCLATASISPYRREVSMKMIDELRDLRSVAGFNALAELVIHAPNDELRQEAQKMLENTYAPPTVWKPWLQRSDTKVHNLAVIALGKLGHREVVPQLIGFIKNSNSEFQSSAIEALSQLGAREAIPQITDLLLKDSTASVCESVISASVCESAIGALSELGRREAIPQISDLLEDKNLDLEIRESAIKALSDLGAREVIPQITNLLKESGPFLFFIRAREIDTLIQLGVREAIPQITNLLKDSDPVVRRNMIEVLRRLGVRGAIPQITDLLKDSDSEVRLSAIGVLSKLGAREAIPQITDLLKDLDSNVRNTAAKALGNFHQQQVLPYEIIKKINGLLQNPSLYAWSGAAEALSRIYRYHPPTLKDAPYNTLITLLQDPAFHVRQHAVQALQALGVQQALPALRPLLHDPNTSVRWATVGALIALKEPHALEHLMTLLESFTVEPEVLMTLASQEEAWRDFLTRLHTQTPNMKMKVLTAVTDKMFAPLTSTGFAQFLSFLEDPDATVRWQTMRAVERVFAGGKHFAFAPPMEKLKTLLFNPQEDLDIRYRAFKTLGHLHTEEAAQILLDFLQQKQETYPDKPSDKLLFMLEGIHLLDNMQASVARDFLIEQLAQITQKKQEWRERRDQVTDFTSVPSTGNFCQNQAPPQQEEDKWPYQQWETELGYALARIDAHQQGLKNLSHPLASVRKGTWTALGQEPDARLLQPLIDLRATADGDIAPITRHAAFRAIDLQLMALEFKGTVQDLAILKALKTTDPAILDRLEWTIGMLEYRCVEKKWCGV